EYKESTSSPSKCEICGCHRNFHRKVEVAAAEEIQPNPKKDELMKGKITSLLDEFFTNRVLEETLQRVVELNSPEYHPEFVREGLYVALKKGPPCHNQFSLLMEHLFDCNVLNAEDIGSGCLVYATTLCGLSIDTPDMFGEIIGNLVMAEAMGFKVFNEILEKVEDKYYKRPLFIAAMKIVDTRVMAEAFLHCFRDAFTNSSSSPLASN
ncbi:hypothetical protein MIMGU_mgv1a018093mg, partial [Erythranthe guttata]